MIPKTKRVKARTTRITEMADFAGVSDESIRRWQRLPGFPTGTDGSVCLWDLAIWRYKYENGSDDGLTDGEQGSDSPNLERLRRLKGDQEELKLAVMRGELIPKDQCQAALLKAASIIREGLDRLQRQCSQDAFQIMDDALREFQNSAESWVDDSIDAGEEAANITESDQ